MGGQTDREKQRGWMDRWPGRNKERGWDSIRGTGGQAARGQRDSRARGQGTASRGDGRGDRERGALGTWMSGTPRWGGTGDRGQREVFKETPQHRARSSTVSPRTVSLSPAGSDQDHPHVPSPWSLPCRVPMSMSCSMCPLPVPVPYVCPCPHTPYLCPLHVPTPPCPSAGGCMAHAHSCVPKHMLSPSPALGSPCHRCSPESTEGGWDVQGQHPWVAPHPTDPCGLTENLICVLQFRDRHCGTELGTEGTVREGTLRWGSEGERGREPSPSP